jgi:hypothetical protein
VAFWSGKCEQSTIIAEGDQGCLQFQDYESFNVISGGGEKRDVPKLDNGLLDDQEDDEDGLVYADDPRWLDLALEYERTNPDAIRHGKEDVYAGNPVKWWQRGVGIYTAIPIDSWDEEIHVQDATFYPFGQDFPEDFDDTTFQSTPSSGTGRNLIRESQVFEGTCQTLLTCTASVSRVSKGALNRATPYVVKAYKYLWKHTKAAPGNLWNWIHMHPDTVVQWVANYVVNQGGGYQMGLASIKTMANIQNKDQEKALQECSSSLSLAGTIACKSRHPNALRTREHCSDLVNLASIQDAVTTTETVTSVMIKLVTPPTVTEHHHHHHTLTKTEWHMSAQVTTGDCKTCYSGQCGAHTTKREAPRLVRSRSFRTLDRGDATKTLKMGSPVSLVE